MSCTRAHPQASIDPSLSTSSGSPADLVHTSGSPADLVHTGPIAGVLEQALSDEVTELGAELILGQHWGALGEGWPGDKGIKR